MALRVYPKDHVFKTYYDVWDEHPFTARRLGSCSTLEKAISFAKDVFNNKIDDAQYEMPYIRDNYLTKFVNIENRAKKRGDERCYLYYQYGDSCHYICIKKDVR